MRKETSNQFTEGLISDLNPINTPKTALTDNLNGTIITYNGNEFSLQNDRGNYELKNCRLKPNYIPVGIKEYGDILYIVSYNPLDEHVEIGSYPSPLQVNEIESPSQEIELSSIIKNNLIDTGKKVENYSMLVTKEQNVIFNGEDYKLYPGDSYKLEVGNETPYRYETFEYFILDEESNSHDITKDVVKNEDGYTHVSWDVPGWITAKVRLAKLASAGLNVRSFYAPKTENGKSVFYEFNMRLNIEDELLKNGLFNEKNLYKSEILFDVVFSGKNDIEYPKYENKTISDITEWYKDNKIVWRNLHGNFNTTDDDIITVTLTPKLVEYKDGKPLYTIVYDNLKQDQEFDLSRVNDKPWNAGESLYKYYVSGDKSELRLEFNVDGPTVSSSKINLEYRIKDLNNNYIIGSENSWEKFNDYYGIGDNYVTIPFDKIQKEEIYILDWRFTSEILNQDGSPELLNNLPSRLIITTELLDGSEKVSLYDRDITTQDLINLYINNVKDNFRDPEIIVNSSTFDSKIEILADKIIIDYCNPENKFNTFVPMEKPFDDFNIKIGNKGEQKVDINNSDFLTGSLWEGLVNWSLKQNSEVLLQKYQKTATATIKSFKGATLHGTPTRIGSDSFYRDHGYYFTEMIDDFNTFDLKTDLLNEHKDYSEIRFTWNGKITSTIPTINDAPYIKAFIEEYKKPFYTHSFYKLRFGGNSVTPIQHNNGSQQSLNGDWAIMFQSNKPEEYNRGEDLACFINTDNKINLTTILNHLYFTKDNIELTEHTSYSSDFEITFNGISNTINTNYKFSNEWLYKNNNLIELVNRTNVLYKLDYYSVPDEIVLNSNYNYETELDDSIISEIDKIKSATSDRTCANQLSTWAKHPIKYNSGDKIGGAGVYCNSSNDNLITLASKIDDYYNKNEKIVIPLDDDFNSVGHIGWFTQNAYWLGSAADFLNSDEYKPLSRV